MHMLGYPSHFGQMECLKLIASPKFSDKRIGYLGLMLLMDEDQEVLTLVTNSLQVDLNDSNHYVQALAMATIANIASAEISRDLAPEIDKLMRSPNAYIRKKAAVCAARMVRKVPELVEDMKSRIASMLDDRNHGVLVAVCSLVIQIVEDHPDTIPLFRQSLKTLIRHTKSLVHAAFTPEYDVSLPAQRWRPSPAFV